MTRKRSFAVLRLLAALVLGISISAASPAATPVDIELVLAIDVSGSIDNEEFQLQRRGYGLAFRDARVIEAIADGRVGRIAVTAMEWSGSNLQQQIVPWTLVDGAASAAAFAQQIETAPRLSFPGYSTSISGAIDRAAGLFGDGFQGRRRVIDISSDGYNNSGRPPEFARDAAVAKGIVINGLAILSEYGLLDLYFEDRVIGGHGAFVVAIQDFDGIAKAIVAKLIREIAAVPVNGEFEARAR
jgi:hypothetical protein